MIVFTGASTMRERVLFLWRMIKLGRRLKLKWHFTCINGDCGNEVSRLRFLFTGCVCELCNFMERTK